MTKALEIIKGYCERHGEVIADTEEYTGANGDEGAGATLVSGRRIVCTKTMGMTSKHVNVRNHYRMYDCTNTKKIVAIKKSEW